MTSPWLTHCLYCCFIALRSVFRYKVLGHTSMLHGISNWRRKDVPMEYEIASQTLCILLRHDYDSGIVSAAINTKWSLTASEHACWNAKQKKAHGYSSFITRNFCQRMLCSHYKLSLLIWIILGCWFLHHTKVHQDVYKKFLKFKLIYRYSKSMILIIPYFVLLRLLMNRNC